MRVWALTAALCSTATTGTEYFGQARLCVPSRGSVVLGAEAVEALAGSYEIVLIADHPRSGQVRGTLRLWVNLEKAYPLLGRADVALDSVGGKYMVPEGSFDAHRHDVFVMSATDGVHLTIGRPVVRGGRLEDGAGTFLQVLSVASNGFAGTWDAFSGPTTYRADGYFCATRTGR